MSRLRKSPEVLKAESPWGWLLEQSQRDMRERRGYVEACELDKAGQYAEADEALRVAGIREELIEDRRRHIDWRLRQGMPAIGSM